MNFHRLNWPGAAIIAALGLFLAVPGSAQAQQGGVVGRIIDARTGAGIPSAQVFVVNTQIGTLSDAEGNYRIANVVPGEREIRVITIGYRSETQTVAVLAGQTSRADFS